MVFQNNRGWKGHYFMKNKFNKLYYNNLLTWMENSEFVTAMRKGLLLCIPFLIIGSFCLVFTSFPIPGYQEWIRTCLDGRVYTAIMWVYNATMGSITPYLILSVSYSYASRHDKDEAGFYMFASFAAYIVFAAESIDELSFSIFNNTWLFTAILVTVFSCILFKRFCALSRRLVSTRYQSNVDLDFRNTVQAIIPVAGVIMVFGFIKMVLVRFVGVNIQNIGSVVMIELFEVIGTGLLGAIVFVFLIHILWFFGIHGSNMLSMVSENMFEQGMIENMAAHAAGGEAVNIFTKTFFDCFVLMGGSGATLCLLFALLLKRGKKKNKTLFNVSIIPALFNINEIVLFGLPVVFNPIMLIPFVLVPLAMLIISAFCVWIGIVPVPISQVGWTTPVIFSGYLCTGSTTGSILQAVLLMIGTAIYMPFITLSEFYYDRLLKKNIQNLKMEIISCEEHGESIDLFNGPKSKRDIVKMLTMDLKVAMQNHEIQLYYQPQVRADGSVYGVEALLRWNHPVAGFLYPPLVIELARQNQLLDELGIMLIDRAAMDLEHLSRRLKKPMHMSVNISPVQFESEKFCDTVEYILNQYDAKGSIMCFEVTEQMALYVTDIISERINRLRDAGIIFHMDDFGMGHSSMTYLQSNEFEAVKLDGSLVRQILDNTRSQDIISGIQRMALPLNYELIAEYVECEEQRQILEGLGCRIYQGALYSLAVPLDELEVFLEEYHMYE